MGNLRFLIFLFCIANIHPLQAHPCEEDEIISIEHETSSREPSLEEMEEKLKQLEDQEARKTEQGEDSGEL